MSPTRAVYLPRPRTIPAALALGLGALALGSAGPATRARPPAADPPGRAEPAPLLVGNTPVSWDEIRPRLAEIAGAQAVEEITLEHLLADELAARSQTLDADDLARERSLFTDTLRRASPPGAELSADRALARVRATRALGPQRFEALLRRSAMLRKLVAPDVRETEDDVRAALEVRFGPRVRCRILVTTSEQEARRARQRLADAPPDELPGRFAAEARALSVDPSGASGGEIGPVSPADPTYAASFREALRTLEPGALSPVLVFQNGYAIALGVERIPGATPPDAAERDARADVRQRLERDAMDRLAARLISSAPLTVLDAGLNWSWSNRARQ